MRRCFHLLLPIALTTACSEVPRQTQSEPGAAKLHPINSVNDIRGQCDVVRFEGHSPNRISGSVRAAYADFGDDGASLRMECNYFGAQGTVRADCGCGWPTAPEGGAVCAFAGAVWQMRVM